MNNIKEVFAKNFIHYRKTLGLTQLELAEHLNYSDKAISKWERGESLPDVITLKEIATLFNLTIDKLISEHPYNKDIPELHVEESHKKTIFNLRLALLSGSAILLITLIAFVLLSLITPSRNDAWLVFIYALPLICITFMLFSIFSKKKNLILLFAELFSISISSILFLSIAIADTWMFFLLPIPVFFILYFALSLSKDRNLK